MPINEINSQKSRISGSRERETMSFVGYLNGNPMQFSQVLTHKATDTKYWYKAATDKAIVVYKGRDEYQFSPDEFRGTVEIRKS